MYVHLGAFFAISILLVVTPGPDTALTTRNALVGGRAPALYTVLGIAIGLTVWTLAASIGIAALIRASEPAFDALKAVGSAYLAYLGCRALWSALRRKTPAQVRETATRRIAPGTALRQGLFCNLGNPKIAVFFTSFLPQFTSSSDPSFAALLLLGFAFCALGLSWLTLYGVTVARAGDFLRRSDIRRALEGVTGLVLIGFGIRLATERRG